MEDLRKRLDTLDGLRAIAALGVLWIHSWSVHENPRFVIGPVDITSILALGGNGVDLFFVISGFCMYYFYADKAMFKFGDFWTFLKKRWIRLSPAFYAATLVYILYRLNEGKTESVIPKFLTSVFYLNSLSPYNAEGFFWSLGAEWQFYMLVPFIFMLQIKIGFVKGFSIISGVLFIVAIISVISLGPQSDLLTDQIIFRYFEFACGILLARYMLLNLTELRNRSLWLILFIGVTYSGRILLSGYVQSALPEYYNILKLFGLTIMSVGFTGVMYLAITSTGYLRLILGNTVLSFIGKISYSFYLWHGIAHLTISKLIISHYNHEGILAPIATFLLSTLVLVPVSYLSYVLLEKPFMSRRKISHKNQNVN